MKHSKKIIFFIVTTLLLGTIIYLIIAKEDSKKTEIVEESKISEAITEDIDYEKYLELRSEAHETETYAILIYDGEEEVSQIFVEEVKISFAGRKSVVYMLDRDDLNEKQFSVVIDDVTDIMKYKQPEITIPTIIVMSKGKVVYKHAGLMYKEELMENLNAKSIE